jgi:hypothetical protein
VAIFMRNITDEVYKTYAFDATNSRASCSTSRGQPRTVGLDLIVTF